MKEKIFCKKGLVMPHREMGNITYLQEGHFENIRYIDMTVVR